MVANVGTLVGMIKQVESNSLASGTTTDQVPEGSSNLYFTAARGRSVISASSPLSYSNTTGILSISGYTGSVTVVTDIDFTLETKTTSTLNFTNGVLTSIT